MNILDRERRAHVIRCLVEGNSIRATVRLTGVAKNTVVKLLVEIGDACAKYQDAKLRNLTCRRIQCDEIWSFCYAKAKNVPADKRGQFGYGDVWTWTALCADTKLIASWMVGGRDSGTAHAFIQDLANCVSKKIQLTTDGHRVYLDAVESAFGSEIDYAMLVKLYGEDPKADTKYSPSQVIGAHSVVITGNPKPRHISTSFVERQNLTMRMSMRRFTRLTNGFSKKAHNHSAALALYFMYYNFCRVHQTLRVTPAMEAGVADHVWNIEEVIALMNATTAKLGLRGPYKKKNSN